MSEDTELTLDHDALIGKITQWNMEDADRASGAGETRADIGQFIEDTGINNKALSQLRAGLRLKKESQRLDWLRSMEVGLEIVGAHIRGQSTADMFDDPDQDEAGFGEDDPVVPFNDAAE